MNFTRNPPLNCAQLFSVQIWEVVVVNIFTLLTYNHVFLFHLSLVWFCEIAHSSCYDPFKASTTHPQPFQPVVLSWLCIIES